MMRSWEKGFYGKEGRFRDSTFRTPHRDLPKFVELLKSVGGKNVLDLGCGTGRHAIVLAREGFKVFGLDIAGTPIEVAKERLQQEGLEAEVRVGNFYEKLPYEDNIFDGVISTMAIHHARVYRIKRAIKEIKRVLRPRGILMIEVPANDPQRVRVKNRPKWVEPGTFIPTKGPEKNVPHHIFSSEEELKEFFPDFEVLDIHFTGRDKVTPSLHYTMFAKKK
jgi:SAM-dependent methyltransferase